MNLKNQFSATTMCAFITIFHTPANCLMLGVGRVRNSSSHEPLEPLAVESGFRDNRVNYKFFESKSYQSFMLIIGLKNMLGQKKNFFLHMVEKLLGEKNSKKDIIWL